MASLDNRGQTIIWSMVEVCSSHHREFLKCQPKCAALLAVVQGQSIRFGEWSRPGNRFQAQVDPDRQYHVNHELTVCHTHLSLLSGDRLWYVSPLHRSFTPFRSTTPVRSCCMTVAYFPGLFHCLVAHSKWPGLCDCCDPKATTLLFHPNDAGSFMIGGIDGTIRRMARFDKPKVRPIYTETPTKPQPAY